MFHAEDASIRGAIVFVTSEADTVVNREMIARLAREWEARRPGTVRVHDFPPDQAVPHDMIDPAQPGQKVDLVYPLLLDLLDA